MGSSSSGDQHSMSMLDGRSRKNEEILVTVEIYSNCEYPSHIIRGLSDNAVIDDSR